MMFGSNKLLVKTLLRENARLRRESERKDRVILELIDKYTHNRIPERLIGERATRSNDLSEMISTYPSDAYSQAIEDAERNADKQIPSYLTWNHLEDEEDDQLS